MSGRDTYDRINSEIKAGLGLGSSKTDKAIQVFKVAKLVAGAFGHDGGGGELVTDLKRLMPLAKLYNGTPVNNPLFVVHGFDDPGLKSKCTSEYLRNRSLKGLASSVITAAGVAASSHTLGINVAGAVVDLNAIGSTGLHMRKIIAIAASYKQTFTIADWCEAILLAKTMKLGARGLSLKGHLLPAGSIGGSLLTKLATAGIKLTLDDLVYATAAEIHWRAFQEQRISHGAGSKVGPASKIFWEIFTRRTATRVFGEYDTAQLIAEPGGWQALGDKLKRM